MIKQKPKLILILNLIISFIIQLSLYNFAIADDLNNQQDVNNLFKYNIIVGLNSNQDDFFNVATTQAETTDQVNKLDKSNKSDKSDETDNTSQIDNKSEDNNNTDNTDLEFEQKKYDDPYEGYNRKVYSFNKNLDRYIIKPIAQLYTEVAPLPVKRMVTNFYSNIQDVNVLINDGLQGELGYTGDSLARFLINSTFGIFGLIDVAGDMGFPKRDNDYGITFGRWGMEDSTYFVIPVIGPSTVRDSLGRGVAFIASPVYFLPVDYSIPYYSLFLVDTRANLLTAEKIMDTVAEDEYIFIRNSYIEYRAALIRGEKPDEQREQHEEKLIDDILDSSSSNNSTSSNNSGNSNNSNGSGGISGLESLKDL